MANDQSMMARETEYGMSRSMAEDSHEPGIRASLDMTEAQIAEQTARLDRLEKVLSPILRRSEDMAEKSPGEVNDSSPSGTRQRIDRMNKELRVNISRIQHLIERADI